MSRRMLLLSTLMASTFALYSAAQTPTNLDDLVKQLGSTKFSERDRAQKELEAIGEPALAALKKAAAGEDLETSRRAGDMVRRLEERLLTRSVLAPKLVKLNLKDVPALEALEELQKLSGYKVNVEGDRTVLANRKITLETGEITFWEALDKICSSAGLTEKTIGAGNGATTNNPSLIRPKVRAVPLPAPAPAPLPVPQVKQLQLQRIEAPEAPAVPQIVPPAPQAPAAPPAIPQRIQKGVAGGAGVALVVAADEPKEAPKAEPKAEVKKVQAKIQAQVQIMPAQIQFDPALPNGRQPSQGITLVPGKATEYPTCYSGAVRLRLMPSTNKDEKATGEVQFTLEASVEPRLKGFQIVGQPKLDKALDNQEQALVQTTPKTPDPNNVIQAGNGVNGIVIVNGVLYNPRVGPVQANQVPLRLKLGEKSADKIAELSGSLSALVMLPREEQIVIEKVAPGQKVKGKDGSSIEIQDVKKLANGDYQIKLTIENAPQQQGNMIGNGQIVVGGFGFAGAGIPGDNGMPELQDKAGKKYTSRVAEQRMQFNGVAASRGLTIIYSPQGAGEPERLVQFGQRSTTISVPFAFRDVRLP